MYALLLLSGVEVDRLCDHEDEGAHAGGFALLTQPRDVLVCVHLVVTANDRLSEEVLAACECVYVCVCGLCRTRVAP